MARPKDMAVKASSKEDKKVKAVKDGRVSKSAAPGKTSSKDMAAMTAAKVGKTDKKSKKAKKAPTPPPESSSESESESEDDDSASDVSSTSESEIVKASKVNGDAKNVNGSAKAAASKAPVDDDDSSDASSSDSESDDEAAPAPAKTGAKTNGKAGIAADDESSSGDSDASDDSDAASDSDEEESAPAKAGTTLPAAVVNGADDSAKSDEDSDDDSSDSSGSDDGDAAEAPAKKRKADADDEPASKKAKTGLPANATMNLFVGNLTWTVDDEWLQREFSAFGECSARVMTDRDSGRSKGFGFVEFTSLEEAVKAHDAQKGTELDGRPMNVDYATPRGQPQDRGERTNQRANKFGDSKSTPSDSLFVGNISFDATAEMLQEAFEAYGTVTRVHLPTDQDTGALKGFGHIGMGSIEEATAAYEAMNGVDVAGRAIRLDYATPRQENGGGFRGGRGGGRGGRGDFGGRGRGDFGGRGRGGFNSRGGGRGRGGPPRGRGNSTNRGGFGNFSGQKIAL